jgi:hypothetical protein
MCGLLAERHALIAAEKDVLKNPPAILARLTALAKTRLRRMLYQPGLLDRFLAGTRLNLTPLSNPSS